MDAESGEAFFEIGGGCIALDIGREGENHLFHQPGGETCFEDIERRVARTDAGSGGDMAIEAVIETVKGAGAFEGEDFAGCFDDEDTGGIARLVGAVDAGIPIACRKGPACFARNELIANGGQGFQERINGDGAPASQRQGGPFCGAPTETGEASQFACKSIKGCGGHIL